MGQENEILPEGTVVDDRYEIGGMLGRGGFATVYTARHVHIDKQVALKVLDFPMRADTPEGIEALNRFKREARAATAVEHPNVVTVHDFGFTGDARNPYLVMELLDGRDLDVELLHRGAMEPRRALALFRACLAGLSEAHKAGIIHRDLKPANLFLDQPGTREEALRILDFGIAGLSARSLKTDESGDPNRLSQEGQVFGTPAYLPPEFIREQVTTPAFDVYQMGLILVEILAGEPAVQEDVPYDCMEAHVKGRLVIPDAIRLSPLGPVLERALSIDHTERYGDALEFLRAFDAIDLERAAAIVAGEAPPQKPGQTLRWGALAALLILLALAIGAAFVVENGETPADAKELDEGEVLDQPDSEVLATPIARDQVQLGIRQSADYTQSVQAALLSRNEVAKDAVETVQVPVNTTPPGAEIRVGGQVVGTSPTPVELPLEKEPVELTLTLDGYETATLSVVPTETESLSQALQPNAETLAVRKRARRRAERRRERRRQAQENEQRAARGDADENGTPALVLP